MAVFGRNMAEPDDDRFDNLVESLGSNDIYAGSFAAEELERYGEKSIEPLIEAAINGKNMLVRLSATAVLMRIGKPVIEFMISQLGEDSLKRKRVAVEFLCYLSGEEVIPHLEQLLTHEHKSMRWVGGESIKFLKKEPYDENFQTSPISPAEQGVYEELRRQYEDQLE